MKVLWVVNKILPEFGKAIGVPADNYGGWIPALLDAVRQFAPNLEVDVCCAGPEGKSAKIGNVNYSSLGAAVEGRFARKPSKKFFDNFGALLNNVHPDVIHFHGSEGLFGIVPVELYAGIKSVVSLQGILQGYYPHYAGGISASEIGSYRNYLNFMLTRYSVPRAADRWRLQMGPAEARALANVRSIMGRTDWDRAWAKYISPDARYYHVGEALRPEFYNGRRGEKDVREHTIFCGGAMAYSLKGGHWLIRAVGALKRKYPDIQLRVANALRVAKPRSFSEWIRKGEYHRYCWHLIEEFGLEKNVVLLPSLTADEVAEELRHAEVFCLPSCCENSPNSLGEAMLMGSPSVATYVGGIPSVAKDGENCILVPSGDPAILADAVSRLFEDRVFAESIADSAFSFASKRYSPAKVVAELVDAYSRILTGD